MSEQFDIKNSKEVLKLGFSLGKAIKQSKENDGKIDAMDIALLMPAIALVGPAFEDIALVPKELKDLSLEEGKELQDYIIAEFGELIDQAKLVEQINLGFKAALSIYELVKSFK